MVEDAIDSAFHGNQFQTMGLNQPFVTNFLVATYHTIVIV